mmetsp:Transcript_15038/g.21078  ORF Transcript_15038/g.21078 Transcript_15038/m.21078 type:complete len:212 (-) Transcript_15038:1773-2408(-)
MQREISQACLPPLRHYPTTNIVVVAVLIAFGLRILLLWYGYVGCNGCRSVSLGFLVVLFTSALHAVILFSFGSALGVVSVPFSNTSRRGSGSGSGSGGGSGGGSSGSGGGLIIGSLDLSVGCVGTVRRGCSTTTTTGITGIGSSAGSVVHRGSEGRICQNLRTCLAFHIHDLYVFDRTRFFLAFRGRNLLRLGLHVIFGRWMRNSADSFGF